MVHAVPGQTWTADDGRSRRSCGPWRPALLVVALALALGTTLISPPPSSAQGAEPPNGTAPRTESDESSPGAGGAVGFVLIGGWIVLGGALFWRGQRRLAARRSLPAPDAEPPSADQDAKPVRLGGVPADDTAE